MAGSPEPLASALAAKDAEIARLTERLASAAEALCYADALRRRFHRALTEIVERPDVVKFSPGAMIEHARAALTPRQSDPQEDK